MNILTLSLKTGRQKAIRCSQTFRGKDDHAENYFHQLDRTKNPGDKAPGLPLGEFLDLVNRRGKNELPNMSGVLPRGGVLDWTEGSVR